MALHARLLVLQRNESSTEKLVFVFQVTLRKTGQIMVMKETKTLDKDAQKIFVKEVHLFRKKNNQNCSISVLEYLIILGSSFKTIEASKCLEIHRFAS